MLRLFYLIRYWALLFMAVPCLCACTKNQDDFILLDDVVIADLRNIGSFITGQEAQVDDEGNIIGQQASEKNFSKAHALFLSVTKRLQAYPKIIEHPIAQNTVRDLQSVLKELKDNIDSLPNGTQKSQFSKEHKGLMEYVHSLMNEHLST